MNISNKIIILGTLMLASLAGCDTSEEDCVGVECQASSDKEDAPGASSPDFRRFEIEIVGEGTVFVDDETCTTADGICSFERPVGAVVTLAGDFSFVAESDDEVQHGRCVNKRACRLPLSQDVHLVADVEDGPSRDLVLDRKSFGLLPGQPGIVIDIFETPYSHLKTTLDEGGAVAN